MVWIVIADLKDGVVVGHMPKNKLSCYILEGLLENIASKYANVGKFEIPCTCIKNFNAAPRLLQKLKPLL